MKILYLAILFSVLFLFGCHQPKEVFYWGNYSSTLYDLKNNPDDETLAAHKKELVTIIDYASKKSRKVPPGVMAEYGYILLKEGNEKEGYEYLDKEIELYPESAIFISRIKEVYKGDEE